VTTPEIACRARSAQGKECFLKTEARFRSTPRRLRSREGESCRVGSTQIVRPRKKSRRNSGSLLTAKYEVRGTATKSPSRRPRFSATNRVQCAKYSARSAQYLELQFSASRPIDSGEKGAQRMPRGIDPRADDVTFPPVRSLRRSRTSGSVLRRYRKGAMPWA
jgi:hypothetical protein